MRLCATCSDCSFENPRGFVSCVRCGELLGPRLRKLEDTGRTTGVTLQHVRPDADGDEKTTVYGAAAKTSDSDAPASDSSPPANANADAGIEADSAGDSRATIEIKVAEPATEPDPATESAADPESELVTESESDSDLLTDAEPQATSTTDAPPAPAPPEENPAAVTPVATEANGEAPSPPATPAEPQALAAESASPAPAVEAVVEQHPARPAPAESLREVDARPLLGRSEHAADVDRVITEALERREARLIALVGELGTGRTRMLQRTAELAAQRAGDVAVHYAALRSRDDGPYAPISRLLLERFGVTPASSPNRVRADMAQEIASMIGGDSESSAATHLIGHVAGIPFPDSAVLRELSASELRVRAIAAVARLAAGDAQSRPQLWLLDDVDDADDGTFELLAALLALSAPIIVAISGGAALAERVAALPEPARVSRHVLAPLSSADAAAAVHALVPSLTELPEELLAALMHRTSGNPRQLVELVAAVQAGGLFRPSPAGEGLIVDLQRLEQGALPLTMADAIRWRLAALPAAELQVMHDAAIIGERFWDGALLALQRAREPMPEAESALETWSRSEDDLALQATLDALESKAFIARIAEPSALGLGELTFQYAGTRTLIYAGLDESERARGHAAVAHWLDIASGLAVEGLPALIAPHLEHAGATERAAAAYLRAATDERSRMRTTMALVYADKALALAPASDLPTQLDALHQRGSILTTLGRYDEALAVFERVARLAWTRGARGRGAAALNRIARIHRERGELERALEHLSASLTSFESVGDQGGVASCNDDIAQVRRMRGELELALTAAEQALQIRVAAKNLRGQAVSLNTLGRIELDLGRYEAAEKRFRKALELRERLGDHEGAVQTRSALGQLAFRRGQITEAIEIYRGALQSARELNHPRFQAYLLSFLGAAYLEQRDLPHAEASLREAKRLATGLGDQQALLDIDRYLATLGG